MNNMNYNEKKKKEQIGKLLLFVVLIIMCTACGKKETGRTGNQERLVIWAWDETFNIYAAKVAADKFQKSRPGIEIDVVFMTSEDIISKLDTGLVSGDYTGLPDIVLIEDYRIQGYLKEYREEFLPVSDIAHAEDFAPYKTSVNQMEGNLYGIPFDSGVAALFYRADLIEKAGYTKEDMQNLTWERYIEIGQEVMKKTGKYMLTQNPNDLGEIRMMLQSAASWYTDEEGNVDIKDNQALKDAITIYRKIFETGISKQILDWDQYVGALQDEQRIIDSILEKLDTQNCEVKCVSLVADEKTLCERLSMDVERGVRSEDVIERSIARIPMYQTLDTIIIDTNAKDVAVIANEIKQL